MNSRLPATVLRARGSFPNVTCIHAYIRKFRYDRRKSREPMLPTVFVSAETGKFWYGTLKEEYWLEMVGKNIRSRARQVSRGDNTPGKIDSESDARMPFQYVCMHQLSGKVGELTEKRLTKRRIRRRNSLDCTVGQWNCSIEYRVFEYEDIYTWIYSLGRNEATKATMKDTPS